MRLLSDLNLNKFRTSILVILFYACCSAQNHAADDAGQYLVMGLGNLSCKSFLNEKDTGAAYYLSWLAGYMTAYNHIQDETYSILGKTKTVDQVESWLRDYCTVNGDASFEEAVRNLLRNLKHFRIKQKP